MYVAESRIQGLEAVLRQAYVITMYKPAKFWDRIAKRYARSDVSNKAVYQEKLTITRKYFTSESNVLEFGSGTGTTAISHAPFVRQIRAIDVSPKMLEIAREKASGISNLTFAVADIDSFEEPEQKFDVIMGHSILHLLDDKEAVITKVYEMLKPNGVFISSTTCMSKKRPVLKTVLAVGKWFGLLPLVRFFSVEELVKSLTNAGFEIDRQWLPDKSDAVFIVARKPA